jgi:uncharacterized protein YndB with AHSA1/START domain
MAELPRGWAADRSAVGSPWIKEQLPADEDADQEGCEGPDAAMSGLRRRMPAAISQTPPRVDSQSPRSSYSQRAVLCNFGVPIMLTNTVQLHRVLRATPERIYRAFLDADAMAKWLPPYGFTCKVHHMEATVGGTFKMSFTNFTSGHGHSFGGEYRELVPNERVRYSDKFDDPNLPGEMETTVVLSQVSCGTELSITQTGIPDAIPVEMCYLGWQESLAQLATLVEPVIPN